MSKDKRHGRAPLAPAGQRAGQGDRQDPIDPEPMKVFLDVLTQFLRNLDDRRYSGMDGTAYPFADFVQHPRGLSQ
jgi:hypothetical protein